MVLNVTWANRPSFNDGGVPAVFLGTSEDVATSGSVALSSAAPAGAELVRLAASGDALRIVIATETTVGDPTVTASTGTLLPDGATEYFRVPEGKKIAVIVSA